jgi:hypothetical protein
MTHEFTPDWKLSQQDQLQVHLSIALTKHVPDWPGATDEQLAAVAGDLSPAIAKAIDDAVREERERCAKVIDRKIIALMKDIAILMKHGGHEIIDQIENSIMPNLEELAAAIRSGETGEKPMFEDCTTVLTCSAIEAEMRDRLAAKDARIAELASAVAGKVQLVEPDPETIAWAEGVFAAEDAKNATIEDLSRKLEASRHRVALLEAVIRNNEIDLAEKE